MVAPHSIDTQHGKSRPEQIVHEITDDGLKSDLTLDKTKLLASAISPETSTFNKKLQELEDRGEKWYHVGNSPGLLALIQN